MRRQLPLIFFAVLLISTQLLAQTPDTTRITGAQSLQISSIVNADTSTTNPQVYILDRGAIYYVEVAFELNSSSKFMAEGDENARPPVLAPAIRADGSSEEWFFKMNQSGMTLEINDLYLLSMRADNATLGWSRAISATSSDCNVILRNVVFDAWTEAGIRVQADNVSLDVQDCHFRNFIHSSSYFGGQPFLSDVNKPGTLIFKNNTFFACNSYIFSVRGLGADAVFEHNTIAYGAVNPFLIRNADDLYIRNNLIYAAHAWGGDPEQVIGGWFLNYPDTVSSSIYRIRKQGTWFGYATAGPEAYNDTTAGLIFDASAWTNVAENNDCFFPQALVDFYTNWNDTVTVADSVTVINGSKQLMVRKLTMARWINDLSQATLDAVTSPDSADYSPNVSVTGNMSVDPQFSDTEVVAHIDELIGYVNRIASRTLDNPWHYKLAFPPAWPVPENLRYTNAALMNAGTDGLPLGDLNWFPELYTSVEASDAGVPSEFTLLQNYPNPFNPETNIQFEVAKTGNVKLTVYNMLGQKITTLIDKDLNAGSHVTKWNGTDAAGIQVSGGVYLLRLEGEGFRATKKMLFIK